jgi:hypothetical protein
MGNNTNVFMGNLLETVGQKKTVSLFLENAVYAFGYSQIKYGR